MVCKSCGYDNPEENHYCGMCGVRLEAGFEPTKDAPEPAAQAAAVPRSSSSILFREEAPQPSRRRSPSVSGPSFLGLNDQPDPTSTHYLLNDDEDRGSYAGLLIATLVLVAIAFAAFHYRRELSARAGPLYAAVLQRVNPQPPAPATPPPTPIDSPAATASTPPPAANDTPPATGASPASGKEDKSAALADMKADAKPPEPDKPVPAAAPEKPAEHLSTTFSPSFSRLKAATCQTATFALPGASDGDTLALGVPNARTTGGGTIVYFAWVSAANTITIQGCNIGKSPQKTAGSSAIRVDLWKH